MADPKFIFICSPYASNPERNTALVKVLGRMIAMDGDVPVAPHLSLTQMLDDKDPGEREVGLRLGRVQLQRCDKMYVWPFDGISTGMSGDLKVALLAGIPASTPVAWTEQYSTIMAAVANLLADKKS